MTAVAMSGGVDSSVAAALLVEEGCLCMGITLKTYGSTSSENDARQTAENLSIPYRALDLSEAFRNHVILPFIEAYEEGVTPNPCIVCNKYIKFGLLLSSARELGCSCLATGHYAQVCKSGSRWLLKKALDAEKDQSYVLYCLTQESLSSAKFPLGLLTKDKVREIARERNFHNAEKKDSQDICFVPGGNYRAFMEAYRGRPYPEGNILDLQGNIIGRHKGHIRYTLGQRRGLGVAANTPVYVTAKNAAFNTVTLGPESALYSKALTADKINLIACESIETPLKVKVKTRYLKEESSACVVQTSSDEIRVEFDEPQRAVTPGQAAVFYDGDIVVGGGTIKQAF